MKPILFFFALVTVLQFSISFACADGLPYSPEGELHCQAVILTISDDQFKEVDSKRTLTLNRDQKRMLRHLFKSVPDQLGVVSSAYNDNIEDASLYSVHSIWLHNRMIAITYEGNYNEPSEKTYWEKAEFVSVADPERLIMSSNAKVYRGGKELSIREVFDLIDELAKTAPDPLEKNKIAGVPPPGSRLMLDHPVASLSFSLPPRVGWATVDDVGPESLLQAFQLYGVTKNVQVHKTW